jgi:hypothetical protein
MICNEMLKHFDAKAFQNSKISASVSEQQKSLTPPSLAKHSRGAAAIIE